MVSVPRPIGIELTSSSKPSNHHQMLLPTSSRSRCLTTMVELSSEKWPTSCFCRVELFRWSGAGRRFSMAWPAFSGFLYAPQNIARSREVPTHKRAANERAPRTRTPNAHAELFGIGIKRHMYLVHAGIPSSNRGPLFVRSKPNEPIPQGQEQTMILSTKLLALTLVGEYYRTHPGTVLVRV